MLFQGRFPKKLALPPSADQPEVELDVVWHVCSDHLLMSLLTGMGGAGCTKPCFLCDWSRDHFDGLRQDSQPRSLECVQRQADGRANCVQPILIAEVQKSAAKKAKEAMLATDAQDKIQVFLLLSMSQMSIFCMRPGGWLTSQHSPFDMCRCQVYLLVIITLNWLHRCRLLRTPSEKPVLLRRGPKTMPSSMC
jgi:hypothetical protein